MLPIHKKSKQVFSKENFDLQFSWYISSWLERAFLPTLEALKGDKVALNVLLTEERKRNAYLEKRIEKFEQYRGKQPKRLKVEDIKKIMDKESI